MKDFVFDLQRFTDDSTLTADEKATSRKISLPHLRMISDIADNPIISELVSGLETAQTNSEFWSKKVAPVYSLIGALYKRKLGKNATLHLAEDAKRFTSTMKIIKSTIALVDGVVGLDEKVMFKTPGEIINEALKIAETVIKLKDKDADTLVLSLVTASLSYGLTVAATFDGVTIEQQNKINKALVKLGGATVRGVVKEISSNASKLTAPFGPVDAGVAIFTGLVEGFSKYSEQIDYYRDDGLPEDIAKKEAILDAVSNGVHGAMSDYLKGVDDIAFDFGKNINEGCKWLGALFSGTLDSFEFSSDDKNYAEWVREGAMRLEYGTSSFDDEIEIDPSDPKTYPTIYTQDGNDRIKNIYPNVTIYGGHGDDMISSYGGAKYDSIVGGNGKDNLFIINTISTIEGGKDDDFILVRQGKNKIDGGAGDDLMLLDGAKNAVIEYTAGDGTDVIYGYDVSDLIKIKGSYSTQVSGNDILIQVASGGIIVKDAKDLKLNINTIEPAEEESLDSDTQGGFTPVSSGIVFMPTFRDLGNAIRGTNGNDRIENTLSNVMIYGFDGNDTIINYGNNVTINAGNGNDSVVNYGASVKVNGGAGDDYIFSEGSKATINGGDGKDTVNTAGNNSIIDGGDGMDSIKNSGEGTDINSGAGVDRIVNLASAVEIYSYLDDNYITNTKSNVTIEGSEDNDYIFNSGDYVSINAGAGNNSVSIDGVAGGSQTVEAGNGNDIIRNWDGEDGHGSEVSIVGGKGNDSIYNNDGEYVTIAGGAGNDVITNSGAKVVFNYANGDGLDKISGFNATSTLSIAGGNFSTTKSGKNIVVTVGKGKVTLTGAASLKKLNIVKADSTRADLNDKSKATVTLATAIKTADASSRTKDIKITGNALANVINGGKGDDTLSGGKGNDTLTGGKGNDLFIYSAGNDKLYGDTGNDTLRGGKGNDSLWGDKGADTFIYDSGDGQDIIYDFANNDLLQITSTFSGTYNKSKKEVYFKVGSTKNALTLKNFSATTFNVNGTDYKISGSKLK